MRPLARLEKELLITGFGGVAIAVEALFGALARGVEPTQAFIPFALLAALFALIQRSSSWRWIVTTARDAPDMPADAQIEEPSRTWLRVGIGLAVWLLLVGMAIMFSPGIAGPMGGLIFGVAAIDIKSATTVARYKDQGIEIKREIGTSWLASGRRPLFKAPIE